MNTFQQPRLVRPIWGVLDTNILLNLVENTLKSGADTALLTTLIALAHVNQATFCVSNAVKHETEKINVNHQRRTPNKLSSARVKATDAVLSFLKDLPNSTTATLCRLQDVPGIPAVPLKVDNYLIWLTVFMEWRMHQWYPLHEVDVVLFTNDKILQIIALINNVRCGNCVVRAMDPPILQRAKQKVDLWDIALLLEQLFGNTKIEPLWRKQLENIDDKETPLSILTLALCALDDFKHSSKCKHSIKKKCSDLHSQIVGFLPVSAAEDPPLVYHSRNSA
ncbi:uncharacterized protein LOC129590263 [Paramacrobiotus metropolitanus]|uniref:uncharacterized protein LOC129590263 n=1 Tax=Paramacrobiotus metropolitanus TaxID=2943436 RepID=UPI0024455FC6|nr:uncharacterized protein LOC129590263 [Paramacrobiotus metropolitanus]